MSKDDHQATKSMDRLFRDARFKIQRHPSFKATVKSLAWLVVCLVCIFGLPRFGFDTVTTTSSCRRSTTREGILLISEDNGGLGSFLAQASVAHQVMVELCSNPWMPVLDPESNNNMSKCFPFVAGKFAQNSEKGNKGTNVYSFEEGDVANATERIADVVLAHPEVQAINMSSIADDLTARLTLTKRVFVMEQQACCPTPPPPKDAIVIHVGGDFFDVSVYESIFDKYYHNQSTTVWVVAREDGKANVSSTLLVQQLQQGRLQAKVYTGETAIDAHCILQRASRGLIISSNSLFATTAALLNANKQLHVHYLTAMSRSDAAPVYPDWKHHLVDTDTGHVEWDIPQTK